MNQRLQRFAPLVAPLLFAIAAWLLYHELRHYRYHELAAGVRAIPPHQLLAALGLAGLAYLALVGYDVLALRYVGKPLPLRKVGFASFSAYAASNNFGFAVLTGGGIRYRLYSAWGLSTAEIARVIAFSSVTFWLGVLAVGGGSLLLEPREALASVGLPAAPFRALGAVMLLAVAAYVVWNARSRTPLAVRGWEVPAPGVRLAAAQVALAATDWVLAGSVLFALLPPAAGLSYPAFMGAFLLAMIAGLLSNVPGGVGVFELAIVALLGRSLPTPAVVGALLVFRGIYYLLPLGAAAVLLASYEVTRRRSPMARLTVEAGRWISALAPQLLGAVTFLGGAFLLASGATPAQTGRLAWLRHVVPLPIIEASHVLASAVGVGLLLIGWGLYRRLDAAYPLAIGLLGAGVLFSLLKGFDYEEALILGGMLVVLLPAHRHFNRRTSLLNEPFTPGWLAAVLLVVGASIWLGFFSYKHVGYSSELWLHFAPRANAPRFLRASLASVITLIGFAGMRLLRPPRYDPEPPTDADLGRALAVIRTQPATEPYLALLGDKKLLFSDAGDAFLMYGVEGRSWVSLGDPVGPPEARTELAWHFRELVDAHNGWTVFYEIPAASLPLYLDLGLTAQKLGEEARVPLDTFSLDGGSRKGLRQQVRRTEREGCRMEVLPPEGVPALLPELERVSDAWLAEKNTREKGFSLGRFDPAYLRHFPVATVRRGNELVAFANLWPAAGHEELSVDLMRYTPQAPSGVMEYLFTELMVWGKEQGYAWFNLGMAPLSGLANRPFTPRWNRIGSLVFGHGESLYGFQGLRRYKEKWDPVWEPKYLASPGGLLLPRILANIASLISGGLSGVVTR